MGCSTSSGPGPREGTCACQREHFLQEYALGTNLGKGSFAQVRAATSSSGKKFAVKIVRVQQATQKGAWEGLRAESALWRQASGHENIVEFFEAFEAQGPATYYMVIEACRCRILDGLQCSSNIPASLSRCFKEMILGLTHVHRCGIVHRDVKPDNFVLGGPDALTTKLTDFGLAVLLPDSGLLFDVVGPALFASPEMLCESGYDTKTDVWSLGVTAYLMIYGDFPYAPQKNLGSMRKRSGKSVMRGTSGRGPIGRSRSFGPEKNQEDVIKGIIRTGVTAPIFRQLDWDHEAGAAVTVFVQGLLERCPEKRPSMLEALEGAFVQHLAIAAAEGPPREATDVEADAMDFSKFGFAIPAMECSTGSATLSREVTELLQREATGFDSLNGSKFAISFPALGTARPVSPELAPFPLMACSTGSRILSTASVSPQTDERHVACPDLVCSAGSAALSMARSLARDHSEWVNPSSRRDANMLFFAREPTEPLEVLDLELAQWLRVQHQAGTLINPQPQHGTPKAGKTMTADNKERTLAKLLVNTTDEHCPFFLNGNPCERESTLQSTSSGGRRRVLL